MRDEAALRRWLRRWVADAVGADPSEVAPDRPLEEFGLSSREAVALSGELEDLLGLELPTTLVWDHPTIGMLAARLAAGDSHATPDAEGSVTGLPRAGGGPADDAREPIAIVGLGCRLPGGADSPERFWDLLAGGTDAVTDEPAGRWPAPTGARGGYLDDVAGFDAEFFGIAPREATAMDPQQRLLLEVCWEALENAAIAPQRLRGTATGVFVGISSYDYALRTSTDAESVGAWTPTGVAPSVTANRLSYLLDLRGPSMAMDTACSSSLVAVHQACRSLRWGECDAALAAGVNLLLHPAVTAAFGDAGALSADGRCKAFDASADGIGRGEGLGVVVLERLSDARRDGHPVLAVVTGSAVNSDGRSNGLTAPNPAAQVELLRAAYADAGADPAEVDYVEAHGTGTLLGDPIEAQALGSVLGRDRPPDRPLLLGSVKTNLGHLEAAAGIAGLIKVVLAMGRDAVPASLHYHEPNPHIPFDEHRLRVVTEPTAWPRGSGRAVAGVSGFGFGGTNAHVVLEQATRDGPATPDAPDPAPPAVLLVSALNQERLRDSAADLAGWMQSPGGQRHQLPAIGHALARRHAHRARAAVVTRDRAEALDGLRALAAGQAAAGVVTGTVPAEAAGPVWVFSGYGSQWRGMARGLLVEEPAFAAAIEELEPLIAAEAGFSITEVLAAGQQVDGVDRAQVAIFAVQVGLAAAWRGHGVEPAAVIGHSMGEVAAALVAGALTVPDAVRVICVRSRLLAEQEAADAGSGAMAAVGLSADELDALADRFRDVSIAVHAAPQMLTVAGDAEQVRALVAHADGLGRTARLLPVRGAGHTAAVDPILGELAAELAGIGDAPPQVPMYSTVLDDPRAASHHEGGYWVAGVRRPVRFTQAVAAAVADGHRTFVELAGHPIAAPAVAATAAASGLPDPLLAVSLRRDTDNGVTFRTALAQLQVHGVGLDTAGLHPAAHPPPALPNTRWRHTPYWAQPAPAHPGDGETALPGVHVELPDGTHAWQTTRAVAPRALLEAAAGQVLGTTELTETTQTRHAFAPGVRMTTTLIPQQPGALLQVHARSGHGWQLLAEATATPGADTRPTVSLAARLREIVAGVMGFAPEAIDPDVPLVELGLDSLMAVRAKNIIEHELGTGPLVLGMLRGAGLADLEAHVADLVADAPPPAPAPAPLGPRNGQVLRTLTPPRPETGREPPLFLFHAAGGPASVYQPLIQRLDDRVPCYGCERVEGELADRVAQYLPLLREVAGHGPYRLAGWSFGGALAYETARALAAGGAEVELLAMIDTVRPDGEPPSTVERWERFAGFVERSYGLELALPLDELVTVDERGQIELVAERLRDAGLAAGVLAHQRDSMVDTRAAERHQPGPWPGPAVLYRADAMHKGAVELDPRYGHVGPDGGWAQLCDRLEIVPVGGDHLAVIDPPLVDTVADDLTARLLGPVRSAR